MARPLVPFSLRYRYVSQLGEGAQGIVYLCDDLRTPGRYVAVKTARPTPESQEALHREADVLRALRGASPVPELRGLLYRKGLLSGFVTEYSGCETLSDVLDRGALPSSRRTRLAVSTADAVLEILRRGYLHRDLKPENLLVADDGRVQILDYGLACRVEDAPEGGELSGTLGYSSPEQLDCRSLTSKSDLFSLGLILYEIACGRSFFDCGTRNFRTFLSHRRRRLRTPVGLDGVERSLAELVQRLIVAAPSLRAGTAEVETRLETLRGEAATVPA